MCKPFDDRLEWRVQRGDTIVTALSLREAIMYGFMSTGHHLIFATLDDLGLTPAERSTRSRLSIANQSEFDILTYANKHTDWSQFYFLSPDDLRRVGAGVLIDERWEAVLRVRNEHSVNEGYHYRHRTPNADDDAYETCPAGWPDDVDHWDEDIIMEDDNLDDNFDLGIWSVDDTLMQDNASPSHDTLPEGDRRYEDYNDPAERRLQAESEHNLDFMDWQGDHHRERMLRKEALENRGVTPWSIYDNIYNIAANSLGHAVWCTQVELCPRPETTLADYQADAGFCDQFQAEGHRWPPQKTTKATYAHSHTSRGDLRTFARTSLQIP